MRPRLLPNGHDLRMGFPTRLLAEDETLVLVLRRHIKALFVPFLVFVVTVAAAVAIAVLTSGTGAQTVIWIIVGVVAAVILARWVLWPFLVWRYTIHAITTRRLILRTGVFNRQGHDMPLSRLNDVSFQHTVWERMLGCGTLVVESAGERGQLTLTDIPKVELVQRTLYRLADELHGRRGQDPVDQDIADSLDDAFDDEYQGPQGRPRQRRGRGDQE
jgi:uncharacterized membrane protein YdbT with pleckstrin-like domain